MPATTAKDDINAASEAAAQAAEALHNQQATGQGPQLHTPFSPNETQMLIENGRKRAWVRIASAAGLGVVVGVAGAWGVNKFRNRNRGGNTNANDNAGQQSNG